MSKPLSLSHISLTDIQIWGCSCSQFQVNLLLRRNRLWCRNVEFFSDGVLDEWFDDSVLGRGNSWCGQFHRFTLKGPVCLNCWRYLPFRWLDGDVICVPCSSHLNCTLVCRISIWSFHGDLMNMLFALASFLGVLWHLLWTLFAS